MEAFSTPRARFVSFGIAGVDPYRMLHGNPQACERALQPFCIGVNDPVSLDSEPNKRDVAVPRRIPDDLNHGTRLAAFHQDLVVPHPAGTPRP